MESSLQAVLPELWGMCSNDQPLLTWEEGASALGSKSNKCGFMQTEVPSEQTLQWHPAPSPQIPEGTPNPAATPISALHPRVWEQEGVGCWGLGQQQHWGDAWEGSTGWGLLEVAGRVEALGVMGTAQPPHDLEPYDSFSGFLPKKSLQTHTI